MAMMFTFSRPSDAEGAAGNADGAAHVFANDGDNGDVGIDGDVIDFLMRQILRKLLAQGFDGALTVSGGNDETNVVLRR